jgi:hypothetical protein
MESFVTTFLKTEITAIPRLLDKYIGKYYNNTLCNGATWMLFLWYILHVIFDSLLNALLRRMKYKEYIRIRLQRSVWYLGFYTTACIYCSATLLRNDIPVIYTNSPFDGTNTPSGHLILGYIVVATFFLHSALWERLKYCHVIVATNYSCLFLFLFFSYFLRFVEGAFRLTVLVSLTQIALELARCITSLVKRNKLSIKVTGTFFAVNVLVFFINDLLVVPILFGYPLIAGFSPAVSILLTLLLTWLILETYDSIIAKAVFHWFSHTESNENIKCDRDIFECSLFPPRNDATYNLQILRKEMIEREERSVSLRKPKNRNMVFQTLKCMVAIKRKLKEKRQGSPPLDQEKLLENNSGQENNATNAKNSDPTNDHLTTNAEEVVGGRLEFKINSNDGIDPNLHNSSKCKKD